MRVIRLILFGILLFFGTIYFFDFSPKNQKKLKSIHSKEIITELKTGNKRFVSNKSKNRETEIDKSTSNVNTLILTCLDPRITPEIIFDQKMGSMIVIKSEGNLDNDYIVKSIEKIIYKLPIQQILVMGHTECDTIIDSQLITSNLITDLYPNLKKIVTKSKEIKNTAVNNVLFSVENIISNSNFILDKVKTGKIAISGAYYDVKSGEVEFME